VGEAFSDLTSLLVVVAGFSVQAIIISLLESGPLSP